MNHKTVNGWVLLSLLMSTLVCAYPQQPQSHSQTVPSHIAAQYVPKTVQQHAEYQHQQYLRQQQPQPQIQHYQVHSPAQWQQQQQQQQQQLQYQQEIRKFAEKPNNLKKVSLDDIDDDNQMNQIDSNAFSWTNMLGQMMQMMFSANANNYAAPTKSDDIDGSGNSAAPSWTNVLAAGLKIISAIIGGGAGGDGIDKVDDGNGSPVQSILTVVLSGLLGNKDPDQVNIMAKQAGQFINIVVNLLDALKTSFSHRSLAARSIGRKDSFSDMGIASITMLKGYVKTIGNSSEKCMQKYVCDANTECNNDIGGNSIFCQMGSYATSFVLERQTGSAFEKFYDAGRRGRQGENCQEIYVECSNN